MKIFRFWKPVLWLICIMTLSLIPGNRLPGIIVFAHFDKVVHAMMYLGLAVLLIRPLMRFPVRFPYLITFILCVLLGALLEVLQARLDVSRSGSLTDGLANLAGALMGIFGFHTLLKGTRFEKWF